MNTTTDDSLEDLQARIVELIDELLRRGCASSVDELRSVVGDEAAWR
jgi:hypothetical protein